MGLTATLAAVEIFSECFEPVGESSLVGLVGVADTSLAVLLVSGADSHCTRWSPTLIEPLRSRGHRVVRYDHRDSGLSAKVPVDEVYTLDDLTDDALAVMDAHGIERAHVVGHSMGGRVSTVWRVWRFRRSSSTGRSTRCFLLSTDWLSLTAFREPTFG